MNITLYFVGNEEHLKYFASVFDTDNIIYEVSRCFMGYCIELECEKKYMQTVSFYVSGFIIEFYLKEAILSKIYEEYVELDVNDAVGLLCEMLSNVCDTIIYKMVFDILQKGGKLSIDSFIIFNIKQIMQNVYEKVDILAENVLVRKEREEFISMLKTYSGLNFRKCSDAFVEFSDENMCTVVLDNNKTDAETMDTDNLLSVLTEYSPKNIVLKNPDSSPVISKLLKDVFKGRILEIKT